MKVEVKCFLLDPVSLCLLLHAAGEEKGRLLLKKTSQFRNRPSQHEMPVIKASSCCVWLFLFTFSWASDTAGVDTVGKVKVAVVEAICKVAVEVKVSDDVERASVFSSIVLYC